MQSESLLICWQLLPDSICRVLQGSFIHHMALGKTNPSLNVLKSVIYVIYLVIYVCSDFKKIHLHLNWF